MNIRRNRSSRRPLTRNRPQIQPLNRTAISYRSLGNTTGYGQAKDQPDGRHNRNVAAQTSFWARVFHNLPTKLALIAIVGSGLYITTLNTQVNLTAQTVASTNGLLRSKTVYQSVAQDILSQSIFNRSKLSINVSGFEREMLARFPELERVTLTIPLLGHEPVVSLSSRRPVLKLATNQGVYLIDQDGRALLKTSDATAIDSLSIPLVTDESQLEVVPGRSVITAATATYISELYALLSQRQVSIASMSIPAVSEELRVAITDQSYYVRFGLDNDPRQSAGEYLALMAELQQKGQLPAEYVDLRVAERVFYK